MKKRLTEHRSREKIGEEILEFEAGTEGSEATHGAMPMEYFLEQFSV